MRFIDIGLHSVKEVTGIHQAVTARLGGVKNEAEVKATLVDKQCILSVCVYLYENTQSVRQLIIN